MVGPQGLWDSQDLVPWDSKDIGKRYPTILNTLPTIRLYFQYRRTPLQRSETPYHWIP
jgi:hypothetical protein